MPVPGCDGKTCAEIFEAAGCTTPAAPSCAACLGGPRDTFARMNEPEVGQVCVCVCGESAVCVWRRSGGGGVCVWRCSVGGGSWQWVVGADVSSSTMSVSTPYLHLFHLKPHTLCQKPEAKKTTTKLKPTTILSLKFKTAAA
jgi:hypothetical protein